jgi:hypothetical protein
MNTYAELDPILHILLNAIAQECRTTQDYLSLEITQVALNALIAARRTCHDEEHDRPTAVRPVDPNLRWPKGMF